MVILYLEAVVCMVSMSDITEDTFSFFCAIFGSVVSAPGKSTGIVLVSGFEELYAFYISIVAVTGHAVPHILWQPLNFSV